MNNLNTHLSCTPGAVRFGQTLVLNTIHTIVNRETILLFSIAFLKKSFDYKSLFQLHDINWTDVLAYNPPTLAFKVFVSIFKLCQGVKLEISSLKKETQRWWQLAGKILQYFFPLCIYSVQRFMEQFFVFLFFDVFLFILIISKENKNQHAVLSKHHKTFTCTHICLLNRLQIKAVKLKVALLFIISGSMLIISHIIYCRIGKNRHDFDGKVIIFTKFC